MIVLPKNLQRFETKGLETLGSPSQTMLSLLWHVSQHPNFAPNKFNEWEGLLKQGALFEKLWPNRTWMSRLRKSEKTLACAGLFKDFNFVDAKTHIPKDQSFFARSCAWEWKEAVDIQLNHLQALPAEQSLPIWQEAFQHALSMPECKATFWLLDFAHKQPWVKEIKLSAETLSTLWSKWQRIKGWDVEKNEALSVSLAIAEPQMQAQKFHQHFWTHCVEMKNLHGYQALWDWCERFPTLIEKMHRLALKDPKVPNAWLGLCQVAEARKDYEKLEKYLSFPSCEVWLKRLDWDVNSVSPLSAWMSYALSQKVIQDQLPLQLDRVSTLLLEAGALMPGTEEEKSLGGNCFFRAINRYILTNFDDDKTWYPSHPEWAYPDPDTGRHPLFTAYSWHSAFCLENAFSWHHVDHEGNTALIYFLEHSYRTHQSTAKKEKRKTWWMDRFNQGVFPLLEQPKEKTMAFCVLKYAHETVFTHWLDLRLQLSKPPSLKETRQIASLAFDDPKALSEWKSALENKGVWNQDHLLAAWAGLRLSKGSGFEKKIKDFQSLLSWNSQLEKDILAPKIMKKSDYHDGSFLEPIALLIGMGAKPLPAQHPGWEKPAWILSCLNPSTQMSLNEVGVPLDVDEAWWKQQWKNWLDHADFTSKPHWIAKWKGLGLEPEKMWSWLNQAIKADAFPPNILNQWMKDHEFSSGITSCQLQEQTVDVTLKTPSRRL